MTRVAGCELCEQPGGSVVWQDTQWRVIRVADAAFPGFYRVIGMGHVSEFSDMDDDARARCMALVTAVERCLIARLAPTKINLAALGNVVPHLHWHVIARFDWDSHFPQPIWGAAQRQALADRLQAVAQQLDEVDADVRAAIERLQAAA